MHIPKTAGSALSEAFRQAYGARLRVYPPKYEMDFRPTEYGNCNFYSGHIGFKVATEIGGELITILRDPVDRFLSTYFFLRQLHSSGAEVSHKTSLATRYDLDQFVQIRDEPVLEHEFRNRMIWQIAYSHRLEFRQELIDAGVSDDDLVRLAVSNLTKFAIVGIQTDMASLVEAIRRRYDVVFSIGRVNVTVERLTRAELPSKTLDQIEWWVNLDQELFNAWTRVNRAVTSPLGT
jgi:hypothetical protein